MCQYDLLTTAVLIRLLPNLIYKNGKWNSSAEMFEEFLYVCEIIILFFGLTIPPKNSQYCCNKINNINNKGLLNNIKPAP